MRDYVICDESVETFDADEHPPTSLALQVT